MVLVDMIEDDGRPKDGEACDAEKDGKGVEGVKVSFVRGEVAKVALSVLGNTEDGSDLEFRVSCGLRTRQSILTR